MIVPGWVASIGAKVWAGVLAVGAAIAIVFGFYRYAKQAGVQMERDKQSEKELDRIDDEATRRVKRAQSQAQVEVESVKVAKDEGDKVNSLDSGVAADKLRDKWARD